MSLLLDKLEDNNLISDIGTINYTEDTPPLIEQNIPLLTDPFCDNIMVR